MKSEELINYIGCSIKSDNLRQIMQDFELDLNPKDKLDYAGDRYWVKSRNKNEDVVLTFNGYNRYVSEFGEPRFIKNLKEDELILTEIDFDNNYSENGIPFSFQLPFGLIQGEKKEVVISKLEQKPKERTSTNYGYAWWFYKEDYRILTALNKNYEFIWLRIIKLNISEITKIELRKELAKQRKNINPQNEEIVKNFKEKLPTVRWTRRMEEGDEVFNEGSIKEVESILLDYIEMLSQYTKSKKASNIFNSVKKVVGKLNKVNNKYSIIDTLEREELCEFIEEIVRSTGFKIKNDIDLTEEWREW